MSVGYWRCGDPLLARPAIRDRRTGCREAIGSAGPGQRMCSTCEQTYRVRTGRCRDQGAGCMHASYGAGLELFGFYVIIVTS